jgi:hypothetical protein
MNSRTSPQHVILKTLRTENKKRILTATRKKHQVIYKGKPIRITTDFSTETLKSKEGME